MRYQLTTVLRAPPSTVPSINYVGCQKQQGLNSKVGDCGANNMVRNGHTIPDGVGDKTRQHPYTLTLSLSLVKPFPSTIKGDVLSP